ncbi:helix-turn-helix domain-containing protein [Ruminiclostridium josui]|uniref:helix-turn-helix domain-containing protein n=1 Tax=Ruminiclostridium josui TaxID=1499 RepID=UPI0004658E52|nr:helix-turn-helix domain-containing protein [Ruminiclostridium josui]
MSNSSVPQIAINKLNLSPKEAAELIGCSEYTIKELARQQRIPSHRVGNMIKFTREGLETWIKAQEKKSWIRV